MFGSKRKKSTENNNGYRRTETITSPNLISNGTQIDGEIICEGDIRIDGIVNGYLTSKSKVVVGETGRIKGDIICANADISGKIEGTIRVKEILYLKNTANVLGDVKTHKLIVDAGAVLNGTCSMKQDGEFSFEMQPSAKAKNLAQPKPRSTNNS